MVWSYYSELIILEILYVAGYKNNSPNVEWYLFSQHTSTQWAFKIAYMQENGVTEWKMKGNKYNTMSHWRVVSVRYVSYLGKVRNVICTFDMEFMIDTSWVA